MFALKVKVSLHIVYFIFLLFLTVTQHVTKINKFNELIYLAPIDQGESRCLWVLLI